MDINNNPPKYNLTVTGNPQQDYAAWGGNVPTQSTGSGDTAYSDVSSVFDSYRIQLESEQIQTIVPFGGGLNFGLLSGKNVQYQSNANGVDGINTDTQTTEKPIIIANDYVKNLPTYSLIKSEFDRVVHNLNRNARVFTGEKPQRPEFSETDIIDKRMINQSVIIEDAPVDAVSGVQAVSEISTSVPSQMKSATAQILLVEDDGPLSIFLTQALKRAGHNVTSAYDGFDGQDKLGTEKFDLLITDLAMPGMDGIDLVKIVRKDYADLPIMCMTGFPSVAANADLDLTEIISKPFHLRELTDRVEKMLNPDITISTSE